MPSPVVSIASGGHRERVLAKRDALVVEHIALVPPIARRIHAKLPASFDLDDLIATGNFALVRAATRYRPREHAGTPFSAYARRCIEGAIKDTFRANKFAEQTRTGLLPNDGDGPIEGDGRTSSDGDERGVFRGNVTEFPSPDRFPAIEARIDQARRFAALRNVVTECLPPLQAAIFDEYYTPSMPELSEVATALGITRGQAEKAHASAIRTLRERMKRAA
jgi:RNA polymerase sigma factor (sigma-70 family)